MAILTKIPFQSLAFTRLLIGLSFLAVALFASAGADYKFPIHQRVSSYGVTNTWSVPWNQLTNLPAWNEEGEPPISVGRAMSLAKNWMISKGADTNCYVITVQFRPLAPSVPPVMPNPQSPGSLLRHRWVYIIRVFQVYQYGSIATCVVLPDGSVVEPECSPNVKKELRYLD